MRLARHRLKKKVPRVIPAGFSLKKIFSLSAINTIAYIDSFFSMFFTLDQARVIWTTHDAHSVSLITWGFYIVSSIVWLMYGYVHEDRVLIITSYGWFFVNGLVVVGIILYH
jgi:uncharacterized protein with PQ loop repeat